MADEQYMHKEYPKFRHHPTKDSLQVADPDDEKRRTPEKDGWVNLKADAEAAKALADEKAAAKDEKKG